MYPRNYSNFCAAEDLVLHQNQYRSLFLDGSACPYLFFRTQVAFHDDRATKTIDPLPVSGRLLGQALSLYRPL